MRKRTLPEGTGNQTTTALSIFEAEGRIELATAREGLEPMMKDLNCPKWLKWLVSVLLIVIGGLLVQATRFDLACVDFSGSGEPRTRGYRAPRMECAVLDRWTGAVRRVEEIRN